MSFFDLPKQVERGDEFDGREKRAHNCTTCGLYLKCTTPKISAIGKGKKGIYIIGDLSTRVFDQSGGDRQGSVYQYLRSQLRGQGIDIYEDCWYTPALKCYTKKATPANESACNRMMIKEIQDLKPKVIVPTSSMAWSVLLWQRMGGRAQSASFYEYAGESIPDQEFDTWIAPIYDPRMVNEAEEKRGNKFFPIWHHQMQNILDLAETPVPKYEWESRVTVLTRMEDAIQALIEARTWGRVAFDYETTSIKPYKEKNKIVMMSVANREKAYAFPYFNDPVFRGAVVRFFLDESVVKIAHNNSFERSWSLNKIKTKIKNFSEDTMLMMHAKNNWKTSNLKFAVYTQYGILGYDDGIEDYIKASPEDSRREKSHATNNMEKAPLKQSLLYNGLDSLFTAWLEHDLLKQLDPIHQLPGYRFFIQAQRALDVAHENGMRIDFDAMNEIEPIIIKRMESSYEDVVNDDEINRRWDWDDAFNPRSDQHVRHFVYDIMRVEPFEWTEKDQPSVDEDTLFKVKHLIPIIKPLLEFRRWYKVADTYFAQLRAEAYNGWINPFYNLFGVRTYRSSSSAINFQNQPKRDKEVKEIIRSLYFARVGHKIVEYDFKSMEICIAAAVTGDPNLIKYVTDLSTDMHLDCAAPLFILPKNRINKALRNVCKNAFVFASFYGSYWKQTSMDIWDQISSSTAVEQFGFDVVAHLRKQGIANMEDWMKHVEKQENYLWHEQFPDYQKFRDNLHAIFREQGYIDYPNGFRYFGPSSKNQVLNAPVQGPAFHVQLWAFTQITEYLEEHKMDSRFIGQIHDSMVVDMNEDEEDRFDKLIIEYATKKVKEHWDWINVPLVVEKAAAEIDQPWAALEEIGLLTDVA